MLTTPITLRRTVAATGVCLTGLMLTACQTGGTISATGATSTVSATAAGASSPSSATSPSGDGNGSGGSNGSGSGSGTTVSSCTSSQLKVSTAYNSADNSGKTMIAFLVLTNTSATACTLEGYTGMDFLDPSGHSLGMSTQRVAGSNAAPLNTQTVAPGKTASEEFTFSFADNDQGNGCVNAGTIAVIPPNQTQALDTQLTSVKTGTIPTFGVCASSITVFPIEPANQLPG